MRRFRKSCAICESGEALCELFHRETSLTKKSGVCFSNHISRAFDDECYMIANRERRLLKKEPHNSEIPLKPKNVEADIFSTMISRKSVREFAGEAISFETLSTILDFSYKRLEDGSFTAPSAGGNYPIQLILIINNVEALKPGIYLYSPENTSLIPLYSSDWLIPYDNVTQSTTLTFNAAFSIHFLGSLQLTCYKYQDRGYRFLNIECGHIAQNISLISEAMHVGAVCSGGFLDGEFLRELNKFTYLDLQDFVELYEMFLGIPKH